VPCLPRSALAFVESLSRRAHQPANADDANNSSRMETSRARLTSWKRADFESFLGVYGGPERRKLLEFTTLVAHHADAATMKLQSWYRLAAFFHSTWVRA
jgi:hypothetical protein